MASEEEWMRRAAAFELLSLALLPPVRKVADALVSGEFEDACAEVFDGGWSSGPGLSLSTEPLGGYAGREADAVFHEIRCEHAMLFAVCGRAPRITPYVGVWFAERQGQTGLLFVGKESMDIERFMRRCGVAKDLAAGQSNDPVDHIGTVCEFMQYLCLVNARAVVPGEGAEVHEDDFEVFHREHFHGYALWCASEIRTCSSSTFYAFVADALELAACL